MKAISIYFCLLCNLLWWAPAFTQDHCQKLNGFIETVEKNGFNEYKGEKLPSEKLQVYRSLFHFTEGGDAAIVYDDRIKDNVYTEVLSAEHIKNTLQAGDEYEDPERELETVARQLYNCLDPSVWLFRKETQSGNTYFMIKNLHSRLFIKIDRTQENKVRFSAYIMRNSTAYCSSGNCRTGVGTYVLETGDIYQGDFFDSIPTGLGTYFFTENKNRYTGGWLNSQLNGFGVMYDEHNAETKKGYLVNGVFVKLDSTKTGICQAGDCKNGTGMVFFPAKEIYIGQFRNGIQHGFGMFEYDQGVYYGQFQNGLYNGYGIVYYANNNAFRGNFFNGRQQGEGVEYYSDGHTVEGVYDNGNFSGSEYNAYGVLERSGAWKDGNFIAPKNNTDSAVIHFAVKLNLLVYAAITGDLKKIKDKQGKLRPQIKEAISVTNISTAGATAIKVDIKALENVNMARLSEHYHSWTDKMDAALGKLWQGEELTYKAGKNTLSATYRFRHMKMPDHYIDMVFTNGKLHIDFH